MKKTMLALLLLLFAVPSLSLAESDELSEKHSLLWKISGNGIEKPSYLFGTMHVSKKLAFNLSEEFYKGIESCDIVGMEANPASMIKDMMGSPLFGGAYSAMKAMKPRINDMYTVEFQTLLPTDIVLGDMLAQEDNVINSLLYRRAGGFQDNFSESTYLDLFLFQAARKLNKETINLEDFEEMSKMVLLSMIPDEVKDKDKRRDASKLYEKL
ncbi:MAG: TraB/GumN family protein, partial [Chlorobi bacterium]|nr:TraB/GumN family protein [Chlorobiota bacterium]